MVEVGNWKSGEKLREGGEEREEEECWLSGRAGKEDMKGSGDLRTSSQSGVI